MPEPDAAPIPGIDAWSFDSIDDIKMDIVPESARPWVEKLAGVAKSSVSKTRAEVERERSTLQSSIRAWDELTESIRGSDDKEAAAMSAIKSERERYSSLEQDYDRVRREAAAMTWHAFEATHADYDSLPEATRDVFTGLIERGLDMFDGKNDVERLDGALKFAMFKTGVGTKAAPVRDEDEDAGKASLLSRGGRAPVVERADVKGMSIDDVLNQFDDLLK
jgi:hypothetical protein